MVQYDVNDLIKTLLNYDLADADFTLFTKLAYKINDTIKEQNKENSLRNDDNVQ